MLCFYYILYIFTALLKWQNFVLQLPMDHTVLLNLLIYFTICIFVLVHKFNK